MTLFIDEGRLEYPRVIKDFGGLGCGSGEHLRQLCQKMTGGSPMQQLTILRMQGAPQLLLVTDEKIDTIAKMIGCKNDFHFSNDFLD